MKGLQDIQDLDTLRMGREAPEVSQERLRNCSPEECQVYWKWFRKLRGKRDVDRGKVKKFLQRSELRPEILEEILRIAVDSVDQGLAVDFEAFCAACRLVAHAQYLGYSDPALLAEVPANAPWFAEKEKEKEKTPEAEVARVPAEDFDFEAVALGVETTPGAKQISTQLGLQDCLPKLLRPLQTSLKARRWLEFCVS